MLWVSLVPDRVRVEVSQHHHRALIKDFGVHVDGGCNRTDIRHFLPLYRPYSKQRKANGAFNPDRENVANDLRQVPENDRPQFVLCLFMVVLTDQALYTYFRDSYDGWRRRTNFPKFGWSGFGPHNENPFKLLRASERNQVVSADSILNLIPRFVRFFVDETTEYFQQHLPAVDVRGYYRAIRGDMGYAFNQGVVVPRFKAEFEALTSGN